MRFISLDCVANQEIESTKKESIALFNKAKHNIKIIAGDPNNDFYQDSKVIASLRKAVGRGVDVVIAYHPVGRISTIGIKREIPNMKAVATSEVPYRHMVSVDGKHVRIEKRHPVGVRKTPAIVCKNAPILARDVETVFNALTKTG